MKHLVISVSPDSSLKLLASHADIIVLDKEPILDLTSIYDTVYIRSHFSQPSTLPQKFRNEIDSLIRATKDKNPEVTFVDGMSNVDDIVAFEDKWHQYAMFGECMPRTELYSIDIDTPTFTHPIYKRRLSSRGSGVTWNKERALSAPAEWIVQETLDIEEELRIYVVLGEVHPIGITKQSMTEGNKAEGVSSRRLAQDEIEFSLNIMKKKNSLDIVGIDIARTRGGELKLMEVNRSPGFAKFHELSGINLADELYEKFR